MKEGGKILVAYDSSERSNAAVDMSLKIAKPAKGSVMLLHVYWDHEERKSDLLMHGIENAEGERRESDISEERHSYGYTSGCIEGGLRGDSHRHLGLGGKLVGSVYQKLKAQSKIPLLTH